MSEDRYHLGMRQLLTRIDDDLHERLKEQATAEGRSVNALVTELLESYVQRDARAQVRANLARRGRLAEVEQTAPAPSLDEVVAANRGSGTAVSDTLDLDRGSR